MVVADEADVKVASVIVAAAATMISMVVEKKCHVNVISYKKNILYRLYFEQQTFIHKYLSVCIHKWSKWYFAKKTSFYWQNQKWNMVINIRTIYTKLKVYGLKPQFFLTNKMTKIIVFLILYLFWLTILEIFVKKITIQDLLYTYGRCHIMKEHMELIWT